MESLPNDLLKIIVNIDTRNLTITSKEFYNRFQNTIFYDDKYIFRCMLYFNRISISAYYYLKPLYEKSLIPIIIHRYNNKYINSYIFKKVKNIRPLCQIFDTKVLDLHICNNTNHQLDNIENMDNLIKADMSTNHLIYIPKFLFKCKKIKHLDLRLNNIHFDYDLSCLENLEYLNIAVNSKIKYLKLPNSLKVLKVFGNRISNINFLSGLNNLVELDISNCTIKNTDFDFSLDKLKIINTLNTKGINSLVKPFTFIINI